MLSYINFLCSGSKLDAIDADNLNTLLEVLSCKELHSQPEKEEYDYEVE